MPFSDFIGNAPVVEQVRQLVASGRLRRALVLAGPEGIGKTTLAVMTGLALNCQAPPQPGDFCGGCASCLRCKPLGELPGLIAAAMEYREAEVKGNAREAAPLQVALHPGIRLYPPDGDFLTMPQARAVIHLNQLQPDAGVSWCAILPDFDRARWMTQAALLKTLEEPGERVTLIALARNPLELLPTVRSRALVLGLQPVPAAELAAHLERRGEGRAAENGALLARLAQGCPGRAAALDLAAYRQMRHEALTLVKSGLTGSDLAAAFRVSEATRAGKEKFESLIEILYSVMQDILYLQSGYSEAVRNLDCIPELTQLAQRMTAEKLARAIEELDRMLSAARRNAFRPLALDAWGLGLAV